jgi:large subunit ribosomal protein L17
MRHGDKINNLGGDVALKVGDRPGGYVRVIKLGFRRGDGAETAMIELVDFNEVYNPNAGKVKTTKKTRRGGGGGTKKAETSDAAAVAVAPEAPVVEVAEEVEATDELASRSVIIEDVTHQAGGEEAADEATKEEKKED